MMQTSKHLVAIACGGTGGHLFPGLAVGVQLQRRGCDVMLMVSPKEVDQIAAREAVGMELVTLPAVGLVRGGGFAFARGFARSYRSACRAFKGRPLKAVLAMGGFTSAAPLVAGRLRGTACFLHESNTIPGRANRWLSRLVQGAFVGFPQAGRLLHARKVVVTGTPVRPQFQPHSAGECRQELGLDPARPVVLVVGGSQGASGVNNLVMESLPELVRLHPELQFLHLTGSQDRDRVAGGYQRHSARAVVHPFLAGMHVALGAASVAVSRAGASSMAEIAAMQVPAILVPYPAATDNHQLHNARAFESTGAARTIEQGAASGPLLANWIWELIEDGEARTRMQTALGRWHRAEAAELIAEGILGRENPGVCQPSEGASSSGAGRTCVTISA